MTEKSHLVKTTIFGNFINILSSIALMLRGLLIASKLGPTNFGLFNSLQVIAEYLFYIGGGTNFGLDKQYPYFLGSGKKKRLFFFTAKVFRINYCIIFIIMISSFIAYIISQYNVKSFGSFIISIAYLTSMLIIFRLGLSLIRAQGRFYMYALLNLFVAILSTLLIYLFNNINSTDSLIIIALSYNIVFITVILTNKKIFKLSLIKVNINLSPFIKMSLSMLLYNLSLTVFVNLDRFIGGFFLPLNDFGSYAFATLWNKSVFLVPSTFATFLLPVIIKKIGSGWSVENIIANLINTNVILIFVFSIILIILSSIYPLIIDLFFIEYNKSILILFILLLSSSFKTLTIYCSTILIGKGNQNILTKTNILLAGFFILATTLSSIFNLLNYLVFSLLYLLSSFIYSLIILNNFNKIIKNDNIVIREFKNYFKMIIFSCLSLVIPVMYNLEFINRLSYFHYSILAIINIAISIPLFIILVKVSIPSYYVIVINEIIGNIGNLFIKK